MGGLGNQLFQIFCIIAYSFENKIPFRIKSEKQDKVSPLDNISARPTYWDNLLANLKRFTYDEDVRLPVYRETAFFVYNKIPYTEQNFKLWGYFQAHKYFDSQYDKIIKLLAIEKQKLAVKEKYKKYFERKYISMHFRIGDYVKNLAMHPVIRIEYYIAAVKYLSEKVKNIEEYNILYFGEEGDNESIQDKIRILKAEYPKLNFIQCDYDIVDWEQMLLMSLCEHNIMANSSFSWWGAYFNNGANKIVCYPTEWNGSTENTADLFPKNWVKIRG